MLPHNHHPTLHEVTNVKLVYVHQFRRIHGTENGKNRTLLIAFLHQTSSVCPSNASLNDEADKNHLVSDLGCIEGVQATRTPETQFPPMSIIAFCLYRHSGSCFTFFCIIKTINHLLWQETCQTKANKILFSRNIFRSLHIAYRATLLNGQPLYLYRGHQKSVSWIVCQNHLHVTCEWDMADIHGVSSVWAFNKVTYLWF